MFNPGWSIGQILNNADLVERLSVETWLECDAFHYTIGKNGDQNINWSQNATLAGCEHNGVDVHLFEVSDAGKRIH